MMPQSGTRVSHAIASPRRCCFTVQAARVLWCARGWASLSGWGARAANASTLPPPVGGRTRSMCPGSDGLDEDRIPPWDPCRSHADNDMMYEHGVMHVRRMEDPGETLSGSGRYNKLILFNII